MASRRLQRQYAFVLSVLGHAAIVAMLTFSISLTGRPQPPAGDIVPISSFMVDESAVAEELARLEAADLAAEEAERVRLEQEAEAARQQEIERQERIQREQEEIARIQAEREAAEQAARDEAIRLEQQAEANRIRIQQEAEAEQRRIEELEQQRLEEERLAEERRLEEQRVAEERRREEEEQRRREEEARLAAEAAAAAEAAELARVEAEIQEAIAAERQARAARDSGLRDQWSRAIAERVRLNWIQPPNAGVGLECVLVVTQLPNGEVIDVVIESCNRDDANIVRSIENAVLNASPLPGPPPGVTFERTIRIRFTPTE